MVMLMRRRCFLLAAVLLAAVALAGCGGDDESPLKGRWVSAAGSSITFGNSTWSDSDGDSGTYTYTGDYPLYTVTFVSDGKTFTQRATFIDDRTLELCTLFSNGFVSGCVELVIDRPTIH